MHAIEEIDGERGKKGDSHHSGTVHFFGETEQSQNQSRSFSSLTTLSLCSVAICLARYSIKLP